MDTTQIERLAVSTREAAELLSVSPRTIQNYIAAKLLPARKIGRRTVIPVRSLEAFLRRLDGALPGARGQEPLAFDQRTFRKNSRSLPRRLLAGRSARGARNR